MRKDTRGTEEGVTSSGVQTAPGNIIRALSSKEVQVRLELDESPTSSSLLRTSPRMWRLSSEENLIENDIRLLRSASNVLNIVREILEQNVPMSDNGGSYVILERLQHLVVRLPEICERIKTCNAALKVQSKSGSEQVNALEEENSQLKLKVRELEGEVEVTKGVVAYFREQYEQELGNRIEVEQDLKHLMARVDAGSQLSFQPRSPPEVVQGQAHVVPIVANSPEIVCDSVQGEESGVAISNEDIEEADTNDNNQDQEAAPSPTITKVNYNLRNKSCESPTMERSTSPVAPVATTPLPPKTKMGWGGPRPKSGPKKRIIRISRVSPAKSMNADGQKATSSQETNGDATTKENEDDKVEGFRRTRSSSPLKEQSDQNPTSQQKKPRTLSPSPTKTTRRKRRQSSPLRGASSSKISSSSSLRSSRQRRHSPRLGESNKVKKLQTKAKLTLRKRRVRGTEQLQSISRVVTLRVRSRTAAESTLTSEGQFKGNIPTKLAPPPLKPEKEFKCKVCGDKFGVEYNLLRHMKYVHEGNRKYECEYCHRRFYQGQHLQQHLRNHTGERPFPCPKCPLQYFKPNTVSRPT